MFRFISLKQPQFTDSNLHMNLHVRLYGSIGPCYAKIGFAIIVGIIQKSRFGGKQSCKPSFSMTPTIKLCAVLPTQNVTLFGHTDWKSYRVVDPVLTSGRPRSKDLFLHDRDQIESAIF